MIIKRKMMDASWKRKCWDIQITERPSRWPVRRWVDLSPEEQRVILHRLTKRVQELEAVA